MEARTMLNRSNLLAILIIALPFAAQPNLARAEIPPAVDLMSCSKKNGEVAMKLENVPIDGFFCSNFENMPLKKFRESVKHAFQGIEFNGKRPREVKVEASQTYYECLEKGPKQRDACSAEGSREDCCKNLYRTARVRATWRGRHGAKRVLTFLNGNVQFFEQKAGRRAQTYVCEPPKDAKLSCPGIE